MVLPRRLITTFFTLICLGNGLNLSAQDCNANFTPTTPGNCNVVTFTPNETDNSLSYQWDFGDGEASTDRVPTHTYFVDASGNHSYNVTLVVSGNCVPDTVSRNVTINVGNLPDPAIESANVFEFINCDATNDNPSFTLEVNNISTTTGTNTSYSIDWGDGDSENSANLPNGTTHTYNSVGLFEIVLTVTSSNGCRARKTYEFFNGNNPGGNVSTTGNTTACIPETVSFPIRDTENNVSGTVYRLWVDDGLSDTAIYQHPPPGVFSYEFLASACDSNYTDLNGRFTIFFEARNPCFTQPGATSVIVNRPPIGDFAIDDDQQCAESVFAFTNTSTPGTYLLQNGDCSGDMRTNWSISPNNGYELVTGDLQNEAGFSAQFNDPGIYNITMVYRSQFSSGCEPDTVVKSICVIPIPESGFDLDQMSGCADFTIQTTNTSNTLSSCREGTDYRWIMGYDPGDCATVPAYQYVNMTNETDIDVEIQFDSAGIYQLGLIVSNDCGIDTSFQTIVVRTDPVTTITSFPDTCFTGPITIQPSVISTFGCADAPTYSWSFPDGSPSSGSGATPPAVTYNSPGVYTYSVTTSNGCGNRTTSQTFEIFAPPTIPNIALNSPICVGSTARFINPNPGTFIYQWAGPAGFTSTAPAPEIVNVTTEQSGTYELTITDPQTGCQNTRTFPLQITNTAPLSITPNPANICIGESIQLTVSGPSNVTWSPSEHLNTATGTTVTVSPPAVGTYQYIVEGTDPNQSCNGLDTVIVVVNPPPVVEAGEPQFTCVDTDIQLIGSPVDGQGGTGTWGGENVAVNGVFNSSTVGIFRVGYQFVDDNGCQATDSTDVCVIPDPIASFNLSATDGCLGLEIAASNTSNTIDACQAATYQWEAIFLEGDCNETAGTAQFVDGTSAISTNAVFRFQQSGSYEISLTVINDCNTVTFTEIVAIGETPQVLIDDIEDACGNVTITPTFTAMNCNSPISRYEWEFIGGEPATFIGMTPPAISYNNPGCYTIKLKVTNACGEIEDTMEFCVLEGPVLEAELSADFVCQGQTIRAVNTSSGDDLTYSWSASSNDINISDPAAATPLFSFNSVPQGDYQITLEIGNPVCEGLTESFDIRVSETPTVTLGEIENFCESARIEPLPTYSNVDFIDSVRWTLPAEADIQTSTELNPGAVEINQAGDYTFSVTVYNACGNQTVEQFFRVLEGPNLDIALDTAFVCAGSGIISVINNSTGDDLSYSWEESSGGQIQVSNPNSANPVFSFSNTPIGDYQLTVTVENPVCDGLTQTFDIRVSESPTVTLGEIEDFCESARIEPVPTYSNVDFIDSVRWTFPAEADIQTSTELNPGAVEINQAGDYTFSVTVYNTCGNQTAEQFFRVLEGPNLDIALDTAFVCAGSGIISVINNSTGDDLSYSWEESSGGQIQVSNPNSANPVFSFSNTPIGDYQLTVTVENPVCDGLTQTFDIRVSESPTVTLGEIEDFCESARIEPVPTYSNVDFIDSVRWTFPAEADIQTSTELDPGAVEINQAGDYTFSVTVYNTCGNQTAEQSFRVLEGPNLDIALDTAFVCAGSGIISVINNSTGDDLSYSWEESSGGQIQISDPSSAAPTFTFSGTSIGDYQLTVTVSNPVCDGLTQAFDIRVSESPTVSLAMIEDFCEIASIQPIATYSDVDFIDSVRWTFPAEADMQTSTELDPGTISINTPGNYTFSLAVYNDCGMDTTQQPFRILEGPNLDIALDTTFACAGASTISVINNSTGDDLSYSWEESSGGQIQISDPSSAAPTFTFSGTSIGDYQLTVTVSNPVCDGLTQTFDIRVSESPTVSLAMIEDFCEIASIQPIATYSDVDFIDSVRWTFPAEADMQTSTELDPGTISINTPGNYTFSLAVYNDCGMDTTQQSFRILEGPNLDIALDTTFACAGASTISVINNSTGDDLSYSWEESSGGQIQISDPSSAAPTFTFSGTSIGDYQLTVTVSNPVCDGLTQTFDIRVSESPTVSLVMIEDFCEIASIQPIATYSDVDFIDSVRWTFPAEADMQTSTELAPGTISINTPGNYTFSLAVYNDCGMDTTQQSFRILEGPNLDIALDTTFACAGASTISVINNSTGDDLSYSWEESSGGQIQISDPSSAAPTFTFSGTSIGDYQLTVTVSNPVCDGLTQTFDIRVSESPTVSLAMIEDFCEIASIQPIATYSDVDFIDSVRWTFPAEADIQTSTELDPGTISINTPGNYTFSLAVYNDCGMDTTQQSFRILEGPNLDIVLDTTFACAGASTISVINNSTGDDLSYSWEESSGGQIQISDPSSAAPTFTFSGTSIGDYQLTVTVSNPVCDGLTQTFDIRVSESPTVTLAAIEDFCEIASIQPIASYSNEAFIDSVRWIFPLEAGFQTSTELDPGTISINTPGNYTFSVAVYNGCGLDTAEQSFRILEGPNLDITLDTTFACSGISTISVINNSTGDDLSYSWEESSGGQIQISDPSSATPTFSFSGTTIGEYQLTVTVSNPVCDELTQTFSIQVSEPPTIVFAEIEDFCESALIQVLPTYSDTSFIDSVRWNFPEIADISTSPHLFPGAITINQSGSFSISVTVFNACGIDTAEQSFQIFKGPSLDITFDTTFACRNDVINVSNLSTGDSLSYNWTANGPGIVSISDANAIAPTFTFPDTGLYIVQAEISNPVCEPIFWQDTVLVSELPSTALAEIQDYCGEALVLPAPSYGDVNRIDSVRWLFPGSTTPTSTVFFPPEIYYDTAGIYTVTLLAYNRCGLDSSSQTFAVLAPIEVDAILSTNFSCELPHILTVENLTIGDSLNFEWGISGPFASNVDFDQQLAEPVFTFPDTGQYIITQRVFNETCGEISWQDTLRLQSLPDPQLEGVEQFCEEVTLTPNIDYFDYRIDSVHWDFSGGEPSNATTLNPIEIAYSGAGTYIYSLTAFNGCGSTTVSDTFVIDTIPLIELGPSDTVCITDGSFQLATASPQGGIWLDSLRRPGVVTAEGFFDPVAAEGGATTLEYLYTIGVCEVSAFKKVLVVDLSFVDGGPDVDACISESRIMLTGGFPAGGWYVGPGVTDSVGIFNPASLGEGCYTVTYFYQLEGTDCVQGDDFTVCVRPLPIPEISVTDSICVNVPVQLFSVGSGEVDYEWLINDSLLYTQASPFHTFADTGYQTVQLISISEFGCRDSVAQQVYVSGPPIADFALDTMMGCAILPVNATNISLGFQYVTYNWDFGNEEQSNLEQPGTIFYDQGLQDTTYYISLLAQNHCGQSVFEDSVIVFPRPIARIDLSQNRGCTPLDVEFNNFSQGLPDSFIWDLGLLNSIYTDSIPPDQSYLAPDSMNAYYTVQMIAINECGQDTVTEIIEVLPDDIRAFFSVDNQVGCEPFEVQFFNTTSPDTLIVFDWFFGDGETDNVKHPTHTFYARGDSTTTYPVVLIADNGCGKDSITIPITVHPAPLVRFSVPPISCARDSVPFINESIDVTGSIWSFGDGDTLLATDPMHLYENAGSYQVDLTAFAIGTGCPSTYSDVIEIRPIPTASLTATPVFGCPPLQITVNNTSTDAAFFNWDYGDGNTDVGNPSSHIYRESGFYEIQLTATDEFGCSDDTVFSEIQVYPIPDIAFEPFADQPCGTPVQVCMENMTEGAQGFDWDFGNGTTSTENSPCLTYETPGIYPVQLIAQNEFLCTETLTDTVIIYGVPEAAFSLPDPPFCEGTNILLDNNSTFSEYAEWTLTNSYFSTEWSPTISLNEVGSLGIQLIVGNGSGCTDTVTSEVEVFPSPTAAFIFQELPVQIPDVLPTSIQFIDKSSADAVTFDWDFGDGQMSEEQNPIHRYLSSYDKVVRHWVANTYGCMDTAIALIDLDTLGGLYIPNALEPNAPAGSGKNTFLPRGIGLSEFHIAVYARTGQLIWESTSLDEEGMPDESWDGTFRSQALPPDTYTWKVHVAKYLDGSYWLGAPDQKGKLRKSGFVYLIR